VPVAPSRMSCFSTRIPTAGSFSLASVTMLVPSFASRASAPRSPMAGDGPLGAQVEAVAAARLGPAVLVRRVPEDVLPVKL
jgi:hypothetical protein